jgi:glyoxylase-like metal-dependent hydrolase (beta-lactamase superfamily II)
MPAALSIPVKFDLLRVGHCTHPECVALRGGRLAAVEFPALAGLIEHPRHGLLLWDTGYSPHFFAATRRFPECLYRRVTPVVLPPEEELLVQLAGRGISPGDIGTIIISHFHADHVAGLRDFPAARFIATRAERTSAERCGRLGRLRRAYLRDLLPPDFNTRVTHVEDLPTIPLPPDWDPFMDGRDLLGDGSLVGLELLGHTASQLGLAFTAESGGPTLLAADACWRIEGLWEHRRPSRLAYPLFANGKAYDETFDRLARLHHSPRAPRILPSHCATSWTRHGGTRSVHRG